MSGVSIYFNIMLNIESSVCVSLCVIASMPACCWLRVARHMTNIIVHSWTTRKTRIKWVKSPKKYANHQQKELTFYGNSQWFFVSSSPFPKHWSQSLIVRTVRINVWCFLIHVFLFLPLRHKKNKTTNFFMSCILKFYRHYLHCSGRLVCTIDTGNK